MANTTKKAATAKTRPAQKTQKAQKTAPAEATTWNDISGTMRIYGNTFKSKKGTSFTKWSVSLGAKTDEGEYRNYYMPVKFTKDANEPDEDGLQTITIARAFLAVDYYINRDGDEVLTPCIIVAENDVGEGDEIPF